MTSISNLVRVPARLDPDRVLYPDAYGGVADPCWGCFKYRLDLATTSDKRVGGGELVRTCLSCYHALASGRPVELPTRDELPELLRSWARWDQNDQVDDELVERMLATLIPGLAETDRNCWWECLKGALLEVQDRNAFGFELMSVPPEERDCERLVADSIAKVDEVIEALLAGAR